MKVQLRKMQKLLMRHRYLIVFCCVLSIFLACVFVSYLQLGSYGDVPSNLVKTVEEHRKHLHVFKLFNDSKRHLHQVLTYCNPPILIEADAELLPSSFLKSSRLNLTSVVIAIRHGDRGPLRPVVDLQKIDCNPYDAQEGKLYKLLSESRRAILDKYRVFVDHSDSSLSYPLAFPGKECQLEKLTAVGVLQHLLLGSQMSALYNTHLDIDSLIEKQEVKIYSTNYSRTYRSAVAFLFGFFAHSSKEAGVHLPSINITEGTLFCGSSEYCTKCDKIAELQRDLNSSPDNFMNTHPAVKDLYLKIRQSIAKKGEVQRFGSLESVFDGLMAYLCHEQSLPCSEVSCVTRDDVVQLLSSLENSWKLNAANPLFRQMCFLKIIGFLNQLVDHFEHVIRGTHAKFTLYSGHDVTLMPLLSALSLFDGTIPPYASRVVFETLMHQPEKGAVNHFLRIIYNGKDVTRFTEICKSKDCPQMIDPGSNRKFDLIPLESFIEYIENKFRQITQSDSFQDACK